MLYLLIVSLLWSFSFVIIKGKLTVLEPNLVSFLRLAFAFLMFLPFFKPKKLSRSLFWQLLLIGAIQFGLMYCTYTAAFFYLPAYMLVLLTSTTPLYVVLFDLLISRKSTLFFWLAAFAAVLGAWLLQYQKTALDFNWKGVLLIQISNLTFAAGQIYYRKLSAGKKDWDNKLSFSVVYLGAVCFTALVALFQCNWQNFTEITFEQWSLLLYLGIVASGLCFFLWNVGATKVSAGSLALMNNMKIPLGVLVSIYFLNESCNWVLLIITLLIFMISLILCEKAAEKNKIRSENKETSQK